MRLYLYEIINRLPIVVTGYVIKMSDNSMLRIQNKTNDVNKSTSLVKVSHTSQGITLVPFVPFIPYISKSYNLPARNNDHRSHTKLKSCVKPLHISSSVSQITNNTANTTNGHRLIIDTPFTSRSTVSYGLIVYAKNNKSWLMVQRKHSSEFIIILRGLYRLTHLPFLLNNITEQEKSLLLTVLSNRILGDEHLISTFTHLFVNIMHCSLNDLAYATTRLLEVKDIVPHILSKLDITNNKLAWNWPKGRIDVLERENPFECAVRELMEETEISLPEPIFVSNGFLTETIHTLSGRKIEARYWIYVINDEIPLSKPEDHHEVADRIWVSTDKCRSMIENNELFEEIVAIAI